MLTLRRYKHAVFAAIALAGASLAGCGSSGGTSATNSSSSATSGTTGNAPPSPAFQVALLTSGDINDGGWNQLAYDGLQAVKKETGADISNQVTKTSSDRPPALRDYGEHKYNLVIGHGFEYGDPIKAIAAKYPDTKFVVVAGSVKQAPNVATLIPKLEDATYLLGMVAGGMTKSNIIGVLGGERAPEIKSTFDAFAQGAQAVNPKVRVLTSYVGSWEDQNKGKEMAKAMIASGADILFHNADQAGKGMFTAAQEAKNVWVFGSNSNQNQLYPEGCLASAVIEMPRAFVDLVHSVQNKKFKPDYIELTMPNKAIKVEWNDALKSKIPPDLMKKVEAAQKQIESGALKIKRKV